MKNMTKMLAVVFISAVAIVFVSVALRYNGLVQLS